MKKVWGKKLGPDIDLISAEGSAMMRKAEQGFGRKFIDVGYRDTDYEVLANLHANSYVHAAFKNHSFSQQLQGLLIDSKGKVRSYREFKAAAQPLVGNYYENWLKAEHQTAVATGQMAAKWGKFEKRKKLLPYLTYVTQGDARVRESHRALNKITKLVDDPFWDTHFPPNGWRCRCDVTQNAGPASDEGIRTSEDQHPPAFRHNAGKTGAFWADGKEPYKTTGKVKQKVLGAAGEAMEREAKANGLEILNRTASGNLVTKHPTYDTDAGKTVRVRNEKNAVDFSKGLELSINLPASPKRVNGRLPVNADAVIQGKSADFKDLTTAKTIQGFVDEAFKDARKKVIGAAGQRKAKALALVVAGYDDAQVWTALRRRVNGILNRGGEVYVETIYVKIKGKYYTAAVKDLAQHSAPKWSNL